MGLSSRITELTEKVSSLEKLYEHINQQVLHNEQMFWMIILGVFTAIGLALFFLAQSMVQKGIEKGMKNLLDDNKLKLDKINPETIGSITLNNSDRDNISVRLVKLGDEPIINVESDKDDARLTINHKRVSTSDPVVFTTMLFNGWSGKALVFADSHENYKLVEITFKDLNNPAGLNSTMVSMLPSGFAPKTKINFKGYGNENAEVLFTINADGAITLSSSTRAMKTINAHVVFIAHDYEVN